MYDEMRDEGGGARPAYEELARWFDAADPAQIAAQRRQADTLFRKVGITFAVYGEGGDPERLMPFDLVPRILDAAEWAVLHKGVVQRARALNAFLHDVYHRREIIRAGRIPEALVIQNEAYRPEMVGFSPPRRVFSHIVGVDVVRTGPSEFLVLEDNCRTPSGVSYMLENREILMRVFPDLFRRYRVAPVESYPDDLRRTLVSVAPPKCEREPTVVVLSPGIYNSAYFEHSFLADLMGVELVEGQDLFVDGDYCYMRTTRGPQRVDVIYRRIDDDFLDPLCFNPDSALGVPGLMNVYRSGGVTLVSAPGAGVADDKAIYTYVPDMIDFYLGEKPILSNVDTWRCGEADSLSYVLDHLDELVVKEVHGSGGYGMLVGPHATKEARAAYAERLKAAPENFIAQPTLSLSTCPIFVDKGLAPRHVDLRPFCLVGDTIRLTPGGLTRVAMREGSLVVNSSQGGGTKDTWVLSE